MKRDDRGKVAYAVVNKWRDDALKDAFSLRVIQLVRERYPRALDDEAAE